MKPDLDETHEAGTQSWVETANVADTDFPIQNLPFGVFRHSGAARVGVAIGDSILDVASALGASDAAAEACASGSLNRLMSWERHRAGACGANCMLCCDRMRRKRNGKMFPVSACRNPKPKCCCQPRSSITPIFMRRFFTRRMSGVCSGPIIRCCRITNISL